MDATIEKLIKEVAAKLLNDPSLLKAFQSDPISLVTKTLGINLDGDQLTSLITGVTQQLGSAKAGDLLGSLKGLL